MQAQGDVLPLDKISDMSLTPLKDLEPSWKQPGHWEIMTHILKVRGWRMNFIKLPTRVTPRVTPCLCWVQVTGHKAVSWQIQGVQKVWDYLMRWWAPEPTQRSSDPGELLSLQWRFQVQLVATPVMVAMSELGTPAAQRRAAFSAMAGRLVQMAAMFWTFSSCAYMSFLL